jgi:hypothetical protein
VGFEPTASWSRTRRSTKLSHSPFYLTKNRSAKIPTFSVCPPILSTVCEPVTDNIFGADLDNPKGYYEFEKVKTVAEDSSWLQERAAKLSNGVETTPPASRIFIIQEVPERGSPETMVISSFIGTTDSLLKACLSVHYLEKILRSPTLPLGEANAGRVAAPCSNRLPLSDTAECESVPMVQV